jgi:cytochrome c oxidase subunit I+III
MGWFNHRRNNWKGDSKRRATNPGDKNMTKAANESNSTAVPLLIAVTLAIMVLGIVIFIPLFIGGLVAFIAILLKVFREAPRQKFIKADDYAQEGWPVENLSKDKLGIWIFIASEILIFGSLLVAYGYVRLSSSTWPVASQIHNSTMGLINTILLLTSSLAIALALNSVRTNNQTGLKIGLGSAFGLGFVFLAIKFGAEWPDLIRNGFTINSGLPGSTYYVLTGVHAMHIVAGLFGISYLLYRTVTGGFNADNHSGVENVGLYWHFVDIVWMFLFPLFYLI